MTSQGHVLLQRKSEVIWQEIWGAELVNIQYVFLWCIQHFYGQLDFLVNSTFYLVNVIWSSINLMSCNIFIDVRKAKRQTSSEDGCQECRQAGHLGVFRYKLVSRNHGKLEL